MFCEINCLHFTLYNMLVTDFGFKYPVTTEFKDLNQLKDFRSQNDKYKPINPFSKNVLIMFVIFVTSFKVLQWF